MCECASVMLNILEYAYIYLNKQISQYAKSVNMCLSQYIAKGYSTNYWAVIEKEYFIQYSE